MKSVRLTKDLRSRILESYLACYDASNPQPEVCTEFTAVAEFAETLRKRLFEEAGVNEKSVPRGFLNISSYIKIQNPSGDIQYLYFNPRPDCDSEYRPVPLMDGLLPIKENDPAYLKYKEDKRLVKEKNKVFDEWQAARTATQNQVRMALDSVNTTGQLLTLWPEAEKFIPSDVLDFSVISVPAVSFTSLNKAVGI